MRPLYWERLPDVSVSGTIWTSKGFDEVRVRVRVRVRVSLA